MKKVFDYIEKYGMIQAGDKVIAGVSGGADSLCLLFLLAEYGKKVDFSLIAVHVEHGIRGQESLEDQEFVENLCKEQGIDLRCVSCNVPQMAREKGWTLEEAGRAARYEAFRKTCEETGGTRIAVAHNQNDQAETMLWNMARGSGLTGAAGIRPVRENIIRPLLCVSRQEIEEYLRSRGISWRTDRTNEEMRYTRNCIRHHILPAMERELNEKTTVHLAQLSQDIRQVEQYLEKTVEKTVRETAVFLEGRAEIQAEKFLQEEELIQERALRLCLKKAGCGLKDVGRRHIRQLLKLFAGQSGKRVSLPGGWMAVKQFDQVCIMQEGSAYISREAEFLKQLKIPGATETPWGILETTVFEYESENIPQNKYTKWLNYDKISSNLQLRTRRPGDYLVINRQGGRKKLKEYFVEEKIPAEKRKDILLVTCGSEILWVVGYRISEAYKITDQTEKALQITIRLR